MKNLRNTLKYCEGLWLLKQVVHCASEGNVIVRNGQTFARATRPTLDCLEPPLASSLKSISIPLRSASRIFRTTLDANAVLLSADLTSASTTSVGIRTPPTFSKTCSSGFRLLTSRVGFPTSARQENSIPQFLSTRNTISTEVHNLVFPSKPRFSDYFV
jgi:hypothetical protein